MPRRDGSGPMGAGAGTGRGMGPCGAGNGGFLGPGMGRGGRGSCRRIWGEGPSNGTLQVLIQQVGALLQQLTTRNQEESAGNKGTETK